MLVKELHNSSHILVAALVRHERHPQLLRHGRRSLMILTPQRIDHVDDVGSTGAGGVELTCDFNSALKIWVEDAAELLEKWKTGDNRGREEPFVETAIAHTEALDVSCSSRQNALSMT
jgi:hypothetical protein